MKRLIFLLTLLAPVSVLAQATGSIQGYCDLGGRQATIAGLNSSNYLQGVIPHCLVSVYLTGSQTLATIYKDGSNTPLTNPFKATTISSTQTGHWLFYAAQGQGYDVQLSGGDPPLVFPSPVVAAVDVFASGGTGSGGSCSPNIISAGCTGGTSAPAAQANILGNPAAGLYAINCTSSSDCQPSILSSAFFYQTVQANTVSLTQEARLNLKSGSNSTVSCVDNPGNNSTDCTVSSTGGGSVNVNGSSVSSPNFNSSLPAPSAALYAPTPYQVSGSNVIATYPGNPPNTLYVFTGNSINDDDHQVLGSLINITGWNCTGTSPYVCAFANSGTNGLQVGEWISVRNVTGWTYTPPTGVGYSNGYTQFQVSAVPNSGNFQILAPNIAAGSGSGGSVEPSGGFLPFQTQTFLPSGERGTAIEWTNNPGTIVGAASSYSTALHPLSKAVTGNPTFFISSNTINDYLGCSSAATIEAAYQSLWEQIHADNSYAVAESTTPVAFATNGCNTINAIMFAVEDWLRGQGPTQANLVTGAYWDYFVDMRGVLKNARDSSMLQQNNFTLEPGGVTVMAQKIAEVLHTHQSYFGPFDETIWCGLPSANSSSNTDNGPCNFLPAGSLDARAWWDAAYANEYMAADTTNGRMKFPIGAAFGSSNQFIFNASGQPGFASGCSGQYLKADNTGCGTPSVVPVPTVVDTSTPVTVSTTNVSEFHFNQNATAATAVTYDLPTAAAGKQFCFSNSYNGSAANTGTLELLTSASGQFIIYTDGTLSATGGFVISTGAAADAACVVGVDSTHWMLYTTRGTWAKH